MRIAAAAALLLLATSVDAATFTVSTNADSGAGSLRQAILQANAAPGKDTIQPAGAALVVALSSPLPPITDSVVLQGFEIVGAGAGAAANGLTIQADDVEVLNVTVRDFAGDGFVMAGRRGTFHGIRALRSRTGIRFTGAENEVIDFLSSESAEAGVAFAPGSSANLLGRLLDGIFFLVPRDDGGIVSNGHGHGIVLDGTGNAVINTRVLQNAGDGIVAGGTLNRIAYSSAGANGGNGITLFAPVLWFWVDGACNTKLLIDVRDDGATPNDAPDSDGVVNAPAVTDAYIWKSSYHTMTFFHGTLDAAPNASYQIDVVGFDGACPTDAQAHAPFVVATNAAGHAAFDHAVAGNRKLLALTATRLLPDGRPGGGTSELSSVADVTPFPCDPILCSPSADLSIEAIDVPANVARGSTVTLHFRITNHGAFPAAEIAAQPYGIRAGGTVAEFGPNDERYERCDYFGCIVEGLGTGESVVVRQEVKITGAPGSHFAESLWVVAALPGSPDPVAANDSTSVSIPIVAPATVPALSTWALVLLGVAIALAGWRIR